MFNRRANSTGDREFLYAVHSYHVEFHLRIADGGNCLPLRRSSLFDIADLITKGTSPHRQTAPCASTIDGITPRHDTSEARPTKLKLRRRARS